MMISFAIIGSIAATALKFVNNTRTQDQWNFVFKCKKVKKLGFIGYYCASIRNFSRKAEPLYDLQSTPVTTKSKQNNFSKKSKDQKSSSESINWTNKHQSILENLIETLKSP